jgi:hypothetical protein
MGGGWVSEEQITSKIAWVGRHYKASKTGLKRG